MKTTDSSATRYGTPAIVLHWATALLVLLAIALIELKGGFAKGSAMRDGMKLLHFQVGALVLLVSLLRIASLFAGSRPEPLAPRGSPERLLGAAVHGLLYLALLALPLSGLLTLVAAGQPISVLGWSLPVWADGSRQLAKTYKGFHELFGNLMIALVALHVGAALWHQFVRRDGVLRRMFLRG